MQYSNKYIYKISAPIALNMLAQTIIQITDTAFLGRVGEIELGASAIAGIFYTTIFLVGMGFSLAPQILIGRRNGEKRFSTIGSIVLQGSFFLFLFALIIIPPIIFYSEPIFFSLLSSNEICKGVVDYLDFRIWGLLFAFMVAMYRAFYVGITQTNSLIYSAIIAGAANIFLDYVLIFGNWGFPEMGIKGAAIASVFSEAIALLFFMLYGFITTDMKKYGFGKFSIQFNEIKIMLKLSIFTMLQYLFSIGSWLLFFVFIEKLGETPLAISNIVRTIGMLIFIPCLALGATASTLVSNSIGAKQSDQVIPLVARIAKLSFIVTLIMGMFVVIFPRLFIQIYTNQPMLIDQSILPLYIFLFSTLFSSYGNVYISAISGTGNTHIALWIEIFALFFYILYFYWIIIVLRSSVALAWASDSIYWAIIFIASMVYINKKTWQNKQI